MFRVKASGCEVGEAPGWGVFLEYQFSFGDQMSLRSGGADVYDFSGGWFETQDGTRIGNIAQKNDKTNYTKLTEMVLKMVTLMII